MRQVKVKTDELLRQVRVNLVAHQSKYEEAVKGYKDQAIATINDCMKELRKRVEKLKGGEKVNLTMIHFDLQVPENHERDYNRVIRMLEMSVDEEVTLEAREFDQFVNDQWEWKREWENVTSSYSGSSSSSSSSASSSSSSSSRCSFE